jgi:hypothetical protein
MAQAHLISAGVELPSTLPHEITRQSHDETPDDDSIDKGIGGSNANTRQVETEVELEDDMMRAQDMPEGPTVTKWEEWAYYMYYVSGVALGPCGVRILRSVGADKTEW